MLKVVLTDGSEITNCLMGTTSDNIIHAGETYVEAAEVLDIITPDNSSVIRVLDENGNTVATGNNLVLNSGGIVGESREYKTCTVTLRHKTDMEIMQDQIAELQEVVIEG